MTNPKRRMTKPCRHCGEDFSLPMCRDKRDHFCSRACGDAWRLARREERRRDCKRCGASFVPRQWQIDNGMGRFCSSECGRASLKGRTRSRSEIEGTRVGVRKAMEEGRLVHKSGPEHHQWMGGPVAGRRRAVASGESAARCRRYRSKNPHKMREWARKRRGRKLQRLEYGTVPALMELQRGRCAICKTGLHDNFHTDHIIPLAKGGAHTRHNIQLLCPTCNLRKSAKDPIDYAQERGMLL